MRSPPLILMLPPSWIEQNDPSVFMLMPLCSCKKRRSFWESANMLCTQLSRAFSEVNHDVSKIIRFKTRNLMSAWLLYIVLSSNYVTSWISSVPANIIGAFPSESADFEASVKHIECRQLTMQPERGKKQNICLNDRAINQSLHRLFCIFLFELCIILDVSHLS